MHATLPEIVLKTLAADLACQVDDLLADRTTITHFRPLPGRRRFPITDSMLNIITIGAGTVACVGPAHETWARQTIAPMNPHEIFAHHGVAAILQHLIDTGCDARGPSPCCLCNRETLRPAPRPPELRLEMLEGQTIASLYQYPDLKMALSYYTEGDRPDVLAAVAWDNDQLAGVAACSADNDHLWQVGIDVRPPFRNRGIGRWLVHQCTSAILDKNKIPYYSFGLFNLASQRIAAAVGYYPAWTTIATR